jgi:hypothetical protein
MPKLRVTITAVVEYDADAKNYPGCVTPEEMLAADLKNADEDTFTFLGGATEWKIAGEVVKD